MEKKKRTGFISKGECRGRSRLWKKKKEAKWGPNMARGGHRLFSVAGKNPTKNKGEIGANKLSGRGKRNTETLFGKRGKIGGVSLK